MKVILKQQRLKLQIVPMYAFGALLFLIFLFDDVLSVSLV